MSPRPARILEHLTARSCAILAHAGQVGALSVLIGASAALWLPFDAQIRQSPPVTSSPTTKPARLAADYHERYDGHVMDDPQEVLLYRCDCGETGCGAVVARCYRQSDGVVWDRFDSGNPPPVDLAAAKADDDALTFSAEEYEVFVLRLRELHSRHPDGR